MNFVFIYVIIFISFLAIRKLFILVCLLYNILNNSPFVFIFIYILIISLYIPA